MTDPITKLRKLADELRKMAVNADSGYAADGGVLDEMSDTLDSALCLLEERAPVAVVSASEWRRAQEGRTFMAIPGNEADSSGDVLLYAATALDGRVMSSLVADLLHLLDYATIQTPTQGDSQQARRVMESLRAMLNAHREKRSDRP